MVTESQLYTALQDMILNQQACLDYHDACEVLTRYVIEKNPDFSEAEITQECCKAVVQFQLEQLCKMDLIEPQYEDDGTKYKFSDSDNVKSVEELIKEIENV